MPYVSFLKFLMLKFIMFIKIYMITVIVVSLFYMITHTHVLLVSNYYLYIICYMYIVHFSSCGTILSLIAYHLPS